MTSESLLAEIEAAAQKLGLAPSTLCRKAINRGNVPNLLRSGASVSIRTAERLQQWIKANTKRAA